MKHPLAALALTLGCVLTARADVETFSIDPAHSFANWEVRHVVARTSGTFSDVRGKVVLDTADLAKSTVDVGISVYGLNSSHRQRDIHLLTEEFLDARNYPDMKFVSTKVVPATPEKGRLTGELSLHGVTRPITLDYQILGYGQDPWGGMRMGFRATTRLSRADFGIGNAGATGPLGNEVDITLLIEGIKLGPDGQPWNPKKAAEEKHKAIAFPMPTQPVPQAVPVPTTPPTTPPAAAPVPQPTPQPAAPEKPETTEDLLRKRLKEMFQ